MEPYTISRNTGAGKGDLSFRDSHRLQFVREILLLAQTNKNHPSLPSMETKPEPGGTLNRRQFKYRTQPTYKIIPTQSFFRRIPHSPVGSRNGGKGQDPATQYISIFSSLWPTKLLADVLLSETSDYPAEIMRHCCYYGSGT
jgi:hypothetical protein